MGDQTPPEPLPPEPPAKDKEKAESLPESLEILEILGDQAPLIGTARRIYRLAKMHFSKEYREEIARLQKQNNTLISGMQESLNLIQQLRENIQRLEERLARSERQPGSD